MLLDPLQSRALFTHALKNHYAVLAVNADSHACVTDCLEAASRADSPIIIETSLWQLEGHAYGAGDAVLGLARYLAELAVLAEAGRYRNVPVVFHTDHIKGPKTVSILTAALRGVPIRLSNTEGRLRASTVSLDASALTDEENIAMLCQLAEVATSAGLPATFEMESEVDEGYTPLERTKRLVGAVEHKNPGVIWLWAPGLGTKHGLTAGGYPDFKFGRIGESIECLKSLTGRDIGLALHGSSGLDEKNLSDAARAGVVKVNWSSESLLIRSNAARAYFTENAAQLDPSHKQWKATAMDNGLQTFVSAFYLPKVAQRLQLLHSVGQGTKFLASLTSA
jgi:fructose/tagatose bisphosphate aldolase